MRLNKFLLIFFCLLSTGIIAFRPDSSSTEDTIISYIVNPQKQDLKLYWKNDSGTTFNSILNLKHYLSNNNHTLVFAMNGGMYKQDHSPQGLYIQKGKMLATIDTASGKGNFYLKPNGIFYITKDKHAVICETSAFIFTKQIDYATQSGPMLVIDGTIHPAFKQASTNLNIRNGVGILPDNRIVFAMSKKEINFYDFAEYFKRIGCKQALYLDGFVSRTYLPEQNWIQTDGNFGVIIGVTESIQKL